MHCGCTHHHWCTCDRFRWCACCGRWAPWWHACALPVVHAPVCPSPPRQRPRFDDVGGAVAKAVRALAG